MPEGGGWEAKPADKWIHYRRPGKEGDPGRYSTCRWKDLTAGVALVYCRLKDAPDKWDAQALRFDKAKFTLAAAKAWLAAHPDQFSEAVQFSDQDQECSVVDCPCEADGGQAQEDFADIPRVEIFEAGIHKGTNYDEAYLDRMVGNFARLAGVLKPPVKLGHGPQDLIMAEGLPAAGWVTRIWREGPKLLATLSDVPVKVFSAIERKAYRRVSSEIRPNFTFKGKHYGPVLWGLALLGADVPYVKTLDDILTLRDEDKGTSLFVDAEADKEGGEPKMDLTQADIDKAVQAKEAELKAAHAKEVEALQAKAKTAEDALSDRTAADKTAGVQGFKERLSQAGVASVFTEDAGLALFLDRLDSAEVVVFADAKKATDQDKATELDFVMKFTERLVQAAKDGKLFVPKGEVGRGGKDGKTQDFSDDALSTDEAAAAERMAGYVNPAKGKE